jgi:hypothetical protein
MVEGLLMSKVHVLLQIDPKAGEAIPQLIADVID